MSDASRYYVPRTLDDPPRIFWWEIDQALLVVFFLVFGMSVDSLMLGLLIGLGCGWGYGKLKAGRHRAFGLHLAYWYLPFIRLKRTPPSHIRHYYG
jgi:conjugal transfer pilus assembly protein TraL